MSGLENYEDPRALPDISAKADYNMIKRTLYLLYGEAVEAKNTLYGNEKNKDEIMQRLAIFLITYGDGLHSELINLVKKQYRNRYSRLKNMYKENFVKLANDFSKMVIYKNQIIGLLKDSGVLDFELRNSAGMDYPDLGE